MCAKKSDEPMEVESTSTGQVLEATADLFFLTAEGMESHLQIKGTDTLFVLAEANVALQSIVDHGGTTRMKSNGKNGNGKSADAKFPYYTDDHGVKRCNRLTVDGERCNQPVAQRDGKYGSFWSCKNYKYHTKENGTDD